MNKKIEYALMALKRMSQKSPGELTTAKEVSDAVKAPFDATARVMQVMASRGLLRSSPGSSGGYTILKDLSSISLFELVEMIEGPQATVKCAHREDAESCEIRGTCNMSDPLIHLNRKIHGFYRGISLQEVLHG